MNKIKLILLVVLSIFACAAFVSGLSAYSEDIEFSGEKLRGPVSFPHEVHMESYECLDCHHDMEDGENILDEGDLEEDNPDILCSACHNAEAKIKTQEAFHRQCMDCHNAGSMAAEPTGPTLCGGCHILTK
jgi:c(7)-type cytochrome triheme protein